MIVVDSSTILEILLRTAVAPSIEARIFSRRETLHAPFLIDLEIAQVLRRYVLARRMTSDRGLEAIYDFLDLPIERYPHELLLERIWELRKNMTAYDAAYVALAESLSAPLVTRDGRLKASRAHHADIEVL